MFRATQALCNALAMSSFKFQKDSIAYALNCEKATFIRTHPTLTSFCICLNPLRASDHFASLFSSVTEKMAMATSVVLNRLQIPDSSIVKNGCYIQIK